MGARVDVITGAALVVPKNRSIQIRMLGRKPSGRKRINAKVFDVLVGLCGPSTEGTISRRSRTKSQELRL
jgi:hypothetical protein